LKAIRGEKMGDIGIDAWSWRMEEHKRKGHNIIVLGEQIDEKTANDAIESEHKLFLKDQRVKFWEKYHHVPDPEELTFWGLEV